ncbi:MAG: HK97 family phage prohead protease [Clostridiales Family XIII bacterium]|jgi:HK97 family phage prohead protease|nr:HK97 family phage prohead protease [Clostridiales Family XIII bacterium]
MQNKEIQRRWYEARFACRDADEEGNAEIEGRAVVYGQEIDYGGWWREVIEKGALDDADMTDVLFFTNHDICKIPLARSRNNNKNSTMQLSADGGGLSFRAGLDVKANADSSTLYSAVSRGDVTGMSFGFYVSEEAWEDVDGDSPLRRIVKISKVVEISAVNWPAYDETEVNARSQNAQAVLDSIRSPLDSGRAKAALDSARRPLDSGLENKSLLEAEKAKLGFIKEGVF